MTIKTLNIDNNYSIAHTFSRLTMNNSLLINNKNRVYWVCQLSGWSIWALLNIVGIFSFDLFAWGKVIILLFVCFAGLCFTHILRYFIKKYSWVDLPLKKIIPRILLSSISIGIVLFILYFSSNYFSGFLHTSDIKFGTIIIWISNLSSIILVWFLFYLSVHLFVNYKRVEIEALIWEAAVKDFELKTLKSQLNPHFMFNAMNSVRALIDEDPENAKTALTNLSNILRYSLKMERFETVPLEEEIQNVTDYLALEAIRFEERLNYSIDVDPRTSKVEIPPMMIQTLVENGIKHGISKKTEGGKISVKTKLNESQLLIQIKSSGKIDEDSLRHSKGFGIDNTKQRLNLLYGDKAIFTIKNELSDEVLAEIKIPIGGNLNESINN
ncbi:MAG: histidine kinase [Ignavibacteriaceae bacterium]|nr:histidine kinase [Ignavibacteriaceae bacterium]